MLRCVPGQTLALVAAIGALGVQPAVRGQGAKSVGAAAADSPNLVAVNEVGRTTVVSMKPDGTYVKKGELVCELDASNVRAQFENQRIGTEGAKAAYRHARLSREAAELAVKEYTEGIYKQEAAEARVAVELARGELKRAEAARAGSRARAQRTTAGREQLAADETAVKKATLALEQAHSKQKTLETFLRPKRLKQLQLEVDRATAAEAAQIAVYDQAQSRQDALHAQLDRARVLAPASGRISVRQPDGRGRERRLEPGMFVRPGQFLFRMIPDAVPQREATPQRQDLR